MSLYAKITAVISSLTLAFSAAAPCCTYAMQASPPDVISTEVVSASKEDAALQIRNALKAHSSEIIVNIDNVNFSNDKTQRQKQMQELSKSMLYMAFDETGSGSEGDYLRYAVRSYKCSITSTGTLTYTISYHTTYEQEAELTKRINEILSSLKLDGMSDYQKIETLYSYVTSHVVYSEDLSDPYIYSAYNAVFNGNAVCQGVAQLMYRMYRDSGISCRMIAGKSVDLSSADSDTNGNHVWLIVKLGGMYYLIDPTWDLRAKNGNYRFFLKGSSDFDSDAPQVAHIAQNDNGLTFPDYNSDEFKADYPISEYKYVKRNYTLGDVNDDSEINSIDASIILAEYARISSFIATSFSSEQLECADVDKDGKIDAVDASQVLAYYAAYSTGKEYQF